MVFTGTTGKINFLRVSEQGNIYGAPGDQLDTEVVVKLDSAPDLAFGFELRPSDQNLPSNLSMLSILRDAYIHQLTVGLAYDIESGKKQGHLCRVEYTTPPNP